MRATEVPHKQYTAEQGCEPDGWTCMGYAIQHHSATAWCIGGSAAPDLEWTIGDNFNNPEEHCCVCGGGTAVGVSVKVFVDT